MADGQSSEALLTAAEIAGLARVQKDVVHNWRRRFDDFPQPVRRRGQTNYFAVEPVLEWLERTGRVDPAEARSELARHNVSATADNWPRGDFIDAATALVALHHRTAAWPDPATPAHDALARLADAADEADPDDECLYSEIAGLPPEGAALAFLLHAYIDAWWTHEDACEDIIAMHRRLGDTALAAVELAKGAKDFLVKLALGDIADDPSGPAIIDRDEFSIDDFTDDSGQFVIADPYAGSGALLAAAARALPDGVYAPRFVGAVDDERLLRLARRRLAVAADGGLDVELSSGEDLPDDIARPDRIVTALPPQSGEPEAVFDALDRISLRMPAESSAVVLGPESALAADLRRQPRLEHLRLRLLDQASTEAVVSLPDGQIPIRAAHRTAAWVMRKPLPDYCRGRVLLADLRAEALDGAAADEAVEDIFTWRLRALRKRDKAVKFDIDRLRRDWGALRPPARAAVAGDERVADMLALGTRLDALASNNDTVPMADWLDPRAVTDPARPPTTSIARLRSQGRLRPIPGLRVREGDVVSDGIPLISPEEVAAPERIGVRCLDRLALGAYRTAELTRPGDVVVAAGPEGLKVWVDPDGAKLAVSPARVIRIGPRGEDRFTPWLLAALIRRCARPGEKLGDVRLPVVSPSGLAPTAAALDAIARRRERVAAEIAALDALTAQIADGLADGTVDLAPVPTETKEE
ncbi:hypothetical protein L0U85_13635 [Glycomyces sp. L485]|uniref:hypothetical protein n=1 Tax=Glycomyces sp. L485 TaxID=2909235 RepID=UPI001F4AD892|nr:hypothetical protein [Glycomyces sp. L485]MCH7231886.1 hypothetical protein [Glycomyces sp. L485]